MTERLFPIQRSTPIPWALAERAYRVYAHFYGPSQSLDHLADRGGFGVAELGALLDGADPFGGRRLTDEQMRLFGIVDAHVAAERAGQDAATIRRVLSEVFVMWHGKRVWGASDADNDRMAELEADAEESIECAAGGAP